jgi:multicomponent Na+:H+ antiporter subunit B
MSRNVRIVVFAGAGLVLFLIYLYGARGLPPFGHYLGPYGDVLNRVATYERHSTDVVSAVNFDYRAFDTLGEEFILFISVIGVLTLLRQQREESKKQDESFARSEQEVGRDAPEPSDAMKVTTLALVGPLVVFGLYIVTHGQISPGGGFQGGVVLATAPLLVYIAGDYETFKKIAAHTLVEVGEAIGALGYVVIGVLGMIAGGVFLHNVLPLGTTGNINSAGTIAVISATVGLEVAGGFALLMHAFLEQAIELRLRGRR